MRGVTGETAMAAQTPSAATANAVSLPAFFSSTGSLDQRSFENALIEIAGVVTAPVRGFGFHPHGRQGARLRRVTPAKSLLGNLPHPFRASRAQREAQQTRAAKKSRRHFVTIYCPYLPCCQLLTIARPRISHGAPTPQSNSISAKAIPRSATHRRCSAIDPMRS